MLRWFSKKRTDEQGARPVAEAGFATTAASSDWIDTVPFQLHESDAPEGAGTDAMALAPADRASAEQRRLAALEARGADAYQYVAEAAARICQTPIAAITLFNGAQWWMEAGVGVSPERAAALAACGHDKIEPGARMTVLNDLANDWRFKAAPPALSHEGIRSYAAVALVNGRDVDMGTLWVADPQARDFSPVQLRTLQLLARQTALLLDARGRSAS